MFPATSALLFAIFLKRDNIFFRSTHLFTFFFVQDQCNIFFSCKSRTCVLFYFLKYPPIACALSIHLTPTEFPISTLLHHFLLQYHPPQENSVNTSQLTILPSPSDSTPPTPLDKRRESSFISNISSISTRLRKTSIFTHTTTYTLSTTESPVLCLPFRSTGGFFFPLLRSREVASHSISVWHRFKGHCNRRCRWLEEYRRLGEGGNRF